MKYYKCLLTEELHFPCYKKNVIYPEDYKAEGRYCSVKEDVSYDSDSTISQAFQEVPEIEYLLQVAKEKYSIGSTFICLNSYTKATITTGIFKETIDGHINEFNIDGSLLVTKNNYHCIYSKGKWAEIVDEFVLPKKWYVRNPFNPESQLLYDYANKYGIRSSYTGGTLFHFPSFGGCTTAGSPQIGYTEITFKQFKKYVLSSKEENMNDKEIIGYKLIKPEYKNAAKSLCGKSVYWKDSAKITLGISENCSIPLLKEAGVLNLWFEPVYESKFKIGDWVYVEQTERGAGGAKERVGIITNEKGTNGRSNDYPNSKAKVKINNSVWIIGKDFSTVKLRKATSEEIKKAQTPDIVINGYTAEFLDDYVRFGCQEYSIDFIKTLNKCLHDNDLKMDYKDQIKEIVEYYKNKD